MVPVALQQTSDQAQTNGYSREAFSAQQGAREIDGDAQIPRTQEQAFSNFAYRYPINTGAFNLDGVATVGATELLARIYTYSLFQREKIRVVLQISATGLIFT